MTIGFKRYRPPMNILSHFLFISNSSIFILITSPHNIISHSPIPSYPNFTTALINRIVSSVFFLCINKIHIKPRSLFINTNISKVIWTRHHICFSIPIPKIKIMNVSTISYTIFPFIFTQISCSDVITII